MKVKTFIAFAAMCSLMLVSCKKNEPQQEEHEYVNLGLASGTLWATCNVGATKPEEYGDYFAWGETTPKTDYLWYTYKYSTPDTLLTKYCNKSDYGKDGFTDGKLVLEAEDDAATVNWGSDWRTPTVDELDELFACPYAWTTQNDVNGLVITGPNGNSLFLPASGYGEGTDIIDPMYCGYINANSIFDSYPYNYYYYYYYYDTEMDTLIVDLSCDDRYYGQSVRAVRK